MAELAVTMFGALIAMLGTNIGLWLKLNGVRQSTRGEIERLELEIAARSDTRAAESEDRWLESYVAANLQWQTYAQQLILSQQAAGDRQVAGLTESVKQARSDLEAKTREAIADTVQFKQVITALEHKVAGLEQTLIALRNEIKVLTEQNRQLIERKDISPAEVESLSAEIEASQTIQQEENQNVA